jgi:hypothetical protein
VQKRQYTGHIDVAEVISSVDKKKGIKWKATIHYIVFNLPKKRALSGYRCTSPGTTVRSSQQNVYEAVEKHLRESASSLRESKVRLGWSATNEDDSGKNCRLTGSSRGEDQSITVRTCGVSLIAM